ncbi:MAG TPA: hypothetical protein DHV62_00940 [Elusimicrobia bacterium]|nr:hypothetical protein [Elusimicrobiota bacterium]
MVRKYIVLITDLGEGSPFPGIMKGVIKSISPEAEIIDLSHQVRPYQVEEASFLLMCNYKYFPQGTILVTVVDPEVGGKRKIVLVKTKNYFFLAPDNGILSWVLKKEKPEKIIEVKNEKYFLKPVSNTFQGRDIFAPVVGWLAKGEKIKNFGPKIDKIKKIPFPEVVHQNNRWIGKIIYIDHFGNLVSNFAQEEFSKLLEQNFSLRIKNKIFSRLSSSYSEVKKGEPCLLWDSFGFLEIALREDNLAQQWRIKPGEKVILEIKRESAKGP